MLSLATMHQTCWRECDGDPGLYPMDLADIPTYSHEDTRKKFFSVATFFGCVELCEDEQMRIQHVNRLHRTATFALPILFAGKLSI